ncbi:MAG: LysR substrate-binding domain-containing protein [Reyranellaceae bacterium]
MARLPSTLALQAFAAAARGASFAQAADELALTPSAVSRQIAGLEARLGLRLFERYHKRIELNAAGRAYLAVIGPALAEIEAATRLASQAQDAPVVSLVVFPTFALRWLIPRLSRFHDRHPGIDLRLTTSLNPVDFTRDAYDLAIRVMQEGAAPDGLIAHKLVEVVTYPVCSKALAARIASPADLAGQTLIVGRPRPRDWQLWLGPDAAKALRGVRWLEFQSVNLAFQAAIDGLGLAMGIDCLIEDDLRSGRLVRPFGGRERLGQPLQLVHPARRARNPALLALRDWLLEEAETWRAQRHPQPA